MRNLGILMLALVFLGCGGGKNPDREIAAPNGGSLSISGLNYEVIDSPHQITSTGNRISGSGRIRFLSPLASETSAQNFKLKFKIKPGGSVTLISNATRELEISMTFSRPADSRDLKVTVEASGDSSDWSTFFRETYNDGSDISIDVHNNEGSFAHILFWNESNQKLLLDSAKGVSGSPGQGFGSFWGLKLVETEVESVSLREPKYED